LSILYLTKNHGWECIINATTLAFKRDGVTRFAATIDANNACIEARTAAGSDKAQPQRLQELQAVDTMELRSRVDEQDSFISK
jgi:hypothetical protein